MRTSGPRSQAAPPLVEQPQLRLRLVDKAVSQQAFRRLELGFSGARAALTARVHGDVVGPAPLLALEAQRPVSERPQGPPVALGVPAVPVDRPAGLVGAVDVSQDRAGIAAPDAAAERAHAALEVGRLDRELCALLEPLVPVDQEAERRGPVEVLED